MGQNASKQEKTKNKQKKNKNNGKTIKEKSNAINEINNENKSKNKTVNVSLSTSKCKYCEKNLIPNKLLRSHLYYCVECYLKKKKNKYLADIEFHTDLQFSEIIPNKLYLGNNEAAKNKDLLKKNNVSAILICGYFLSEFFPDDFTYKTLEFEDNEYEIITYALVKGIDFIDNNNCVFVHCRKGVSRSSSIVIGYIMYHHKKTYDEAYQFVLEKKNNIQPNNNFVKQLKEFEEMIKVCNYDKNMIKEFCNNFTDNKYGKFKKYK
jgi:protein-tyrosine phosphatase